MEKKQIILLVIILVLLILLVKNKEYFDVKAGDIYGVKNHDNCDEDYKEINIRNGENKLCVKERVLGNKGIRNIQKEQGNLFSDTDDNSGNTLYIPNKSKYIGCIKKNIHDKNYRDSEEKKEYMNFPSCSDESGNFFGMSIPEFKGESDYKSKIFEEKKLKCYNFNDKIPNLNQSLADDYNCDKLQTEENRYLGGLDYIALYQKDNKYQGLNFNSGIVFKEEKYTFDDIEQIRNNVFFWYKTYDDVKNYPIIRSGIRDSDDDKFIKIQNGFNNQKIYILKDYSGNSNTAELKHIIGLGSYIVKKNLQDDNNIETVNDPNRDTHKICSDKFTYFTERTLNSILKDDINGCNASDDLRMEDDFGEIGGYKYSRKSKKPDLNEHPINSGYNKCVYNNINIEEKINSKKIARIWNNQNEIKNKFCPVIELERMKLADKDVQLEDIQDNFTLNMKFKLNKDIKDYQAAPLFSFIVHNKDDKEKNHKVLWSLHAKKPKYIEKSSESDDSMGLVYRGFKVKRIRFIKKQKEKTYTFTNNKNYFYLNFGLRTIDDEHIDLVKGGKVEYIRESKKDITYKYSKISFSGDTNIKVYTNAIYEKPKLHYDNAIYARHIITDGECKGLMAGYNGMSYVDSAFDHIRDRKAKHLHKAGPYILGSSTGIYSDFRPYLDSGKLVSKIRRLHFQIIPSGSKYKISTIEAPGLYLNRDSINAGQGEKVKGSYKLGYLSQIDGVTKMDINQIYKESNNFSNNYAFVIKQGVYALGQNNWSNGNGGAHTTWLFDNKPQSWTYNKILIYQKVNQSDILPTSNYPNEDKRITNKLPPYRDLSIYNIFEENKSNIYNYLFPTEMKKSIEQLNKSKESGDKSFPHYYHYLKKRWYPKYPEVKKYVFAIGDRHHTNFNEDEFFVDIILKESVEAHKLFIQDIKDGSIVEDVTVQLWDETNTTSTPTFEQTLKRKEFQNVPIVTYQPIEQIIEKDIDYEIELKCMEQNKVKIYVNTETNETEFTLKKDSLNLDKEINKEMSGYFQIGGDLSSSTPMVLKELILFKNEIENYKEPYLSSNTESETRKGLKKIHQNIILDLLKAEENLFKGMENQLTVSQKENPHRTGGDLGNYFMLYHKRTKKYLNNDNLQLEDITENNIDSFIWAVSGNGTIIEDNNFNFKVKSETKSLINSDYTYKFIKINKNKDISNQDIYFYEDILILNQNKLVSYRGNIGYITYNPRYYNYATFQLHPIPNKYEILGNLLYSCNYKAVDNKCRVKENIIGYNFNESLKHDNDNMVLYGKKGNKYYSCKKPCTDVGDWKTSTKSSYSNGTSKETNSDYKNLDSFIDYDDKILDNRKLLFFENKDYINTEKLNEGELLKVTKLNSSKGLTLNEDSNLITNLDLGYKVPSNKYKSGDTDKPQQKKLPD